MRASTTDQLQVMDVVWWLQVHLLHTLANATRDIGGCTVVLTGDYHHADIKVVMVSYMHVAVHDCRACLPACLPTL
jgi:hypothetical protein